jgi:amino acid permease
VSVQGINKSNHPIQNLPYKSPLHVTTTIILIIIIIIIAAAAMSMAT